MLGLFKVYTYEKGWYYTYFELTPAYNEVKFMFDDELRLSKKNDWITWRKVQEEIATAGIYLLESKNGKRTDRFIIRFDEDKARVRLFKLR